jgi:hypothetical protein
MSTRQTACAALPCVGDASVVMTAFGVCVRRLCAALMTGMVAAPKLDNMIVYIVNQVVHHVN